MVKAEREGLAADILPLTSGTEDGVALVLPGSGIKGALRTQAERIVRTLLARDVPDDVQQQIDVPLVDALFGSPGRRKGKNKPTLREERLGRGALSVDECYANQSFDRAKWEAVVSSKDVGELKEKRRVLGGSGRMDHAFHVAVDRWTGGAAERFLFSGLEPQGVEWAPIVMELDLERVGAEEREAAQALLLLVLRDLAAGRIPLGYATNRGMGAVEVGAIRYFGALPGGAAPGAGGLSLVEAGRWKIPDAVTAELDESFRSWREGAARAAEVPHG